MQNKHIRMKALTYDFDQITVLMTKNYYSGRSPHFYVKDVKYNENSKIDNLEMVINELSDDMEYKFSYHFRVGDVYEIRDAYGLCTTLDFSYLALCDRFEEKYYTDVELGSFYSKYHTLFKVWAPTATVVYVRYIKDNREFIEVMERSQNGVFVKEVQGDLDGCPYVYMYKHGNRIEEGLDPYAYSSTANSRMSVVIDIQKTMVTKYTLEKMAKKTDAIIYEISVRDMTIQEESGIQHKGNYLGLSECHTKSPNGYSTGLDYIASLGVTHVQIMPITDFATVDDEGENLLYNWGYDPLQFGVLEGSYSEDVYDPYSRIIEAKKMIQAFHQKGIRVNLDVVFNHLYDVFNNPFEKSVPRYFLRRRHDGTLSNGSWCGNDFNTTAKMCQRYVLDMCQRLQMFYGVDGFRFDLMGLLDIDTMNRVAQTCSDRDPSFMVYGEGWDMDTALPYEKKTIIANQHLTPHVGYFNDAFRNIMRGDNDMYSRGFISHRRENIDGAMKAIMGSDHFKSPSQVIQYTECHDNTTCFDKLCMSNSEEDEIRRERRAQMMLGSVLLAQGVPFIHSGQEFLRTKSGVENSYCSPDNINQIDYIRREKYNSMVEFVRFLISLRKNNPCFRYPSYDMIHSHNKIERINDQVIKYHLSQERQDYSDFYVYFNPTLDEIRVGVEEGVEVLYHPDKEDVHHNEIKLTPVSLVILARKEEK